MPSKTVQQLLGEGGVPKPSSLWAKSNPDAGEEAGVLWRKVTVVGVAPKQIDDELYEAWLEEVEMATVNSEHSLGEIPVEDLNKLPHGYPEIDNLIKQAQAIARHTGAVRVVFTTAQGLREA